MLRENTPTMPAAEQFASYLQYPDIHSTGLPLLLPPPHQHLGGAFQQLYQQQKMRAAQTLASQVTVNESLC